MKKLSLLLSSAILGLIFLTPAHACRGSWGPGGGPGGYGYGASGTPVNTSAASLAEPKAINNKPETEALIPTRICRTPCEMMKSLFMTIPGSSILEPFHASNRC